jgi:hypothetical protein
LPEISENCVIAGKAFLEQLLFEEAMAKRPQAANVDS